MTIEKAYHSLLYSLKTIYDDREAKSIARIVFEDAFSISNFKRQDDFGEKSWNLLNAIKARLLNHEPVQYILGFADFYGLKFKMNQHVLIPRQETEELVFWILEEENNFDRNAEIKVLDIGTGSGCIPVAIKHKRPNWKVDAIDISKNALKIAIENAKLNNVQVNFFQADILKKQFWAEFENYDIIVSNPPYIPKKEVDLMPKNVVKFEPHLALFVEDGNPLIFYKKIAEFAVEKLNHCGKLFFETNEFNAVQVLQMIENMDFANTQLKKDLNEKDRMISAEIRIV